MEDNAQNQVVNLQQISTATCRLNNVPYGYGFQRTKFQNEPMT